MKFHRRQFLLLPGVDRLVPISRLYQIADREFRPHNTVFPLVCVEIGGQRVVTLAGSSAVEDRYKRLVIIDAVKREAAVIIEDGARRGLTEWTAIREHVHKGLQKFVYDRTKRRPMIVPVVMEV